MKLPLIFHLWRKKPPVKLSKSEIEILMRENEEARKGAIDPFSIDLGANPITNVFGTRNARAGNQGGVSIIGTPLSEENVED